MSSPTEESSKTIVLISGANQGVGFEIVKKLSNDPNFHILMGTRSLSNGQAAISSLPNGGVVVVEPIELDVTSDPSIAAAASVVATKYGRLDVLINNAGIGPYAFPAEASTRERFTRIFSTNVTGAACLTDAFIPLLQKSSQPRIIFVSSGVGSLSQTLDPSRAGVDAPAYKASKAAMNMLMATYATKLTEDKWRVNSCTPRLSATAFTKGVGRDPSIGAGIACRLATGEVEGTGGFWDSDGTVAW
ncbi:MAG: hypothetical protein ASARMPRED_006501 [Alectoria sarmentosa]|nr:MAG: hypothetical protein ASARMPRED_006501 [Alectoria sarmentosa]